MAPGKSSKKQTAARRAGIRRARVRNGPPMVEGEARVDGHVKMILDPCNANLMKTAYRGQDGFIQRFSNLNNFTIEAPSTAFLIVYYPGYNNAYFVQGDPSVTFTVAYGGYPGPGNAFLTANAGSQRVVSACIDFAYTGTELARQGIVYSGVLKSSVFGTAVSINTVQTLLGHGVRTPDASLETKWVPSPTDEEYWQPGVAAPSNDDGNVIVIAGSGLPSGYGFAIKQTLIAEWLPKTGLGFAAVTPSSADPSAGLERVRSKLSQFGNWWQAASHAGHEAYRVVGGLARGYERASAAVQWAQGARAAAPLMLAM